MKTSGNDETLGPAATQPSASKAAEPEARIGQMLGGRYRLVRLLGGGGMGHVYEAEHVTLRRKVAIKCMKPSVAADPSQVGRFMREAHALSLLAHPHIVGVLDFGNVSSELYLAMEYLEGQALGSWVRDAQGLPPLDRVALIIDQALDALNAAHLAGIIHRDLKPDNIFLTFPDGERPFLKLVDFGLAHIDEAVDRVGKLTSTSMIAGTPLYMSPEQCRSLSVTAASDLYSLGCVMTELLQGHPPFRASFAAELLARHMFAPVPPLARPAGAPPVPALLERLRLDLLAKQPEQRPASAAEAQRRLREAMDPLQSEQRLPGRKGDEPLGDRAARVPRWEGAPPAPQAAAAAGALASVGLLRAGSSSVVGDGLDLGLASLGLRLLPLRGLDGALGPGLDALVLDAGADDAVALLGRLASSPVGKRVVVCLAGADVPTINRLVAAGAADVVAAPVTSEGLGRKLQRLLRRRR